MSCCTAAFMTLVSTSPDRQKKKSRQLSFFARLVLSLFNGHDRKLSAIAKHNNHMITSVCLVGRASLMRKMPLMFDSISLLLHVGHTNCSHLQVVDMKSARYCD